MGFQRTSSLASISFRRLLLVAAPSAKVGINRRAPSERGKPRAEYLGYEIYEPLHGNLNALNTQGKRLYFGKATNLTNSAGIS
jgi:hypothetical protein